MRWMGCALLLSALAVGAGGQLDATPSPQSQETASLASFSGRAMGTTWAVKIVPGGIALDRERLAQQISARLEQLEQQFSTYRSDSTITRFNRSTSTDWQPVSPEIAFVASESRRISQLTGGGFDVTVEPLVSLWGFGAAGRRNDLPTAAEIAATRARIGWAFLEVRAEPPAWRKTRPDLAVDFSSMAKGYASDEISLLLRTTGAPNHFAQVGGDIRTGGNGASGGGWRAGIEQPVDGAREIACVVALSGQALSTSGVYRNAFMAGGRRYGHIIDPRTGSPVTGPLAEVSVIRPTCAESSAWATALFVVGLEEGLRIAKRERLACRFVVREADRLIAHVTPEFEQFLR